MGEIECGRGMESCKDEGEEGVHDDYEGLEKIDEAEEERDVNHFTNTKHQPCVIYQQ